MESSCIVSCTSLFLPTYIMPEFLQQIVTDAFSVPLVIPLNTADKSYVGSSNEKILQKYKKVSDMHASFYVNDKGVWHVEDLNSTYGVFLNGKKTRRKIMTVDIDDVIGLGAPDATDPEAFLCTLCSNDRRRMKYEVIELSDDEAMTDVQMCNDPVVKAASSCQSNCIYPENEYNKNEYERQPVLPNGSQRSDCDLLVENCDEDMNLDEILPPLAYLLAQKCNSTNTLATNKKFDSNWNFKRDTASDSIFKKTDRNSVKGKKNISSVAENVSNSEQVSLEVTKNIKCINSETMHLKSSSQNYVNSDKHNFTSSANSNSFPKQKGAKYTQMVDTVNFHNSAARQGNSIESNGISSSDEYNGVVSQLSQHSKPLPSLKIGISHVSKFNGTSRLQNPNTSSDSADLKAEKHALLFSGTQNVIKECSVLLKKCVNFLPVCSSYKSTNLHSQSSGNMNKEACFLKSPAHVKEKIFFSSSSKEKSRDCSTLSSDDDNEVIRPPLKHKNIIVSSSDDDESISSSVRRKNIRKKRRRTVSPSPDLSDSSSSSLKPAISHNAQSSKMSSNSVLPRGQNLTSLHLANKTIEKTDLHGTVTNISSTSKGDYNYSKNDDVITISDDDDYLQFSCFQPLKSEPLDESDSDKGSDYEDIFVNACDVAVGKENSPDVESIEKIKDFLGTTTFVNQKLKRNSRSGDDLPAENNSCSLPASSPKSQGGEESCSSDVDESNPRVMFPSEKVLKMIAETKERINSDSSNSSILSTEKKNALHMEIKSSDTKSNSKYQRKTLLTDPKPLSVSAIKSSCRKERIAKESKTQKQTKSSNHTRSKASCATRKDKRLTKEQIKLNNVAVGKGNGLNGFRIPKKKACEQSDVSLKDENSIILDKECNIQPKSSVKRRHESFSSRSGFLTEEVPNKMPKNVPETKKVTSKMPPPSLLATNNSSKSDQDQISKRILYSTNVGSTVSVGDSQSIRTVAKCSNIRESNVPFSDSEQRTRPTKHFPNVSILQTKAICGDPRTSKSVRECHQQSETRNTFPTNLSHVRSMSEDDSTKNQWRVLEEIVNLNTNWLKEQSNMKKPPPVLSDGIRHLPLQFENSNSYKFEFTSLIKLEIWSSMYRASKPMNESNRDINQFFLKILSRKEFKDYNMVQLTCEAPVNGKDSFLPCEGSVLIIHMLTGSQISPSFGFVLKHKISDSFDKNEWQNTPLLLKNCKLWTFDLLVKKRKQENIVLNKITKVFGLCSIKDKLRLCELVASLKSLPLSNDILKPTEETFSVQALPSPEESAEYSYSQSLAINSISAEVRKSVAKSKILLIQGPPGTGKTHTIIGLIHKLLHTPEYKAKILVAAPSNVAIDEIGEKLIDLKEESGDKSIKFVRIGLVKEISKQILGYSLNERVKKIFRHNVSLSLNKEIEMVNRKLLECTTVEDFTKHNKRIEYLKTIVHQKQRDMDANAEMNCMKEVLNDSNIVLTTLSSCSMTLLMNCFNVDSVFSCCIVDEAAQCTEPETLSPLMLGINKLILVGDHQQLPAKIESQVAKTFGFQRSLFERFVRIFENHRKLNPLFRLTEQFRMHSQICSFPSRYFYSNLLVTTEDIDSKRDFPTRPYTFLNLQSRDYNLPSESVQKATLVIVSICSQLLDIGSLKKIGIIIPNRKHQIHYLTAFSQNRRYEDIEVDTVDGFQGREKDIIIVSCVPANESSDLFTCPGLLNVAITRAQQCLIICGSYISLSKYPDWHALTNDAIARQLFVNIDSSRDVPAVFHQELIKRM